MKLPSGDFHWNSQMIIQHQSMLVQVMAWCCHSHVSPGGNELTLMGQTCNADYFSPEILLWTAGRGPLAGNKAMAPKDLARMGADRSNKNYIENGLLPLMIHL